MRDKKLVDHYAVLDIARDATPDQIKKAWSKLQTLYHPDKNHGLPEHLVKLAEEKLKDINAAKAVLLDPEKRSELDQLLNESEKGSAPAKPTFVPRAIDLGLIKAGETRRAHLDIQNLGGPPTTSPALDVSPDSEWLSVELVSPSHPQFWFGLEVTATNASDGATVAGLRDAWISITVDGATARTKISGFFKPNSDNSPISMHVSAAAAGGFGPRWGHIGTGLALLLRRGQIGIGLALLFSLASMFGAFDRKVGPPTAALASAPSLQLPFEDHGACPFEGCQYGNWIGQGNITVYKDRNIGSPIVFKVSPHEKVKALTGVVVTTKAGVAEVLEPITVNGAVAPAHSKIALLTYVGEGCYKVWFSNDRWKRPDVEDSHSGGNYHLCLLGESAVRELAEPEATWWVKIQNKRGEVGWALPDNFGTSDQLLVKAILEPTALESKLAKIDKMIRQGADINAPEVPSLGGEDSPAVATINTRDTVLITALVERGLSLSRSDECLANVALQALLKPNGLETLELLLNHGLKMDCVDSPYTSLLDGCSLAEYDANAAIRGAQFLAMRGFDVNRKDRYGKTVFDSIREYPKECQANLAPLVKVLESGL